MTVTYEKSDITKSGGGVITLLLLDVILIRVRRFSITFFPQPLSRLLFFTERISTAFGALACSPHTNYHL